MHCQFCKQEFVSKYTLERHISRKHKESDMDDNISVESDNNTDSDRTDDSDISEASMDNEDQNSDTSVDEEEEKDFWNIMIKETVKHLCYGRIANGLPAHIPDIADLSEFLEGQNLSAFINRLRKRYREIRDISTASDNDDLLDLLNAKMGRMWPKVPSDKQMTKLKNKSGRNTNF